MRRKIPACFDKLSMTITAILIFFEGVKFDDLREDYIRTP
jgi:hypothetical protein